VSAPRVLIVKFSAIGDCVMAAPALSAFRRAEPDALMVWAADPRCSAVIDRNRLVNEVYDIPRAAWKRDGVGWMGQIRHYLALRRYGFDFGFDLQGHGKTAICLRLSGAKRRIAGYAIDPAARVLNPLAPGNPDGTHRVLRNRDVLAGALKLDPDLSPIMPSLAAERETVRERFGSGFVSIHVGAGATWKQWPSDRWAAVARHLLAQGRKVLFLGGLGERAPEVEGAMDACEELSLAESVAAVAESEFHLAADTGSGHMAAAYRVPVLSIFGKTKPELYRPYTDRGIVLKAGERTEDVSVESVLAEIPRLEAWSRCPSAS